MSMRLSNMHSSTIMDYRTAFKVKEGHAIICGFADEETMNTWPTTWPPMKLPASLKRMVTEMESATFKIRWAPI